MNKKVIAVAADVECTGFDKVGGDVLSTGLVEILEDFTLGREAEFFSRPTSSKHFTEKAQEIHGISYFRAMEFPTRRESCVSMLHWLKPLITTFPLPFVYHGTGKFDHSWLKWHFTKEELDQSWAKAFPEAMVESTLTMARAHLKQLQDHKLKTLSEFYGISTEKHHSALPDARACAQIYCNIKKGESIWTGKLL